MLGVETVASGNMMGRGCPRQQLNALGEETQAPEATVKVSRLFQIPSVLVATFLLGRWLMLINP